MFYNMAGRLAPIHISAQGRPEQPRFETLVHLLKPASNLSNKQGQKASHHFKFQTHDPSALPNQSTTASICVFNFSSDTQGLWHWSPQPHANQGDCHEDCSVQQPFFPIDTNQCSPRVQPLNFSDTQGPQHCSPQAHAYECAQSIAQCAGQDGRHQHAAPPLGSCHASNSRRTCATGQQPAASSAQDLNTTLLTRWYVSKHMTDVTSGCIAPPTRVSRGTCAPGQQPAAVKSNQQQISARSMQLYLRSDCDKYTRDIELQYTKASQALDCQPCKQAR